MKIENAKDLTVYKLSFQLAMEIFELTKNFPTEGCPGESDPPILAVHLPQFARSVGKTAIRGTFYQ